VSPVNQAAEMVRIAAPHLRIIDDDTWHKAQAIKQSRRSAPFQMARKPKRMFSGLIKCGQCGSSLAVAGRDKTGKHRMCCTRAVEAGTCRNGRRPYVEDIEARVLKGLAEKLKHPEHPAYLARFVEEYNRERRQLAGTVAADRARLDRRSGEVKRELERAIDAVVKGLVDPESMRERLAQLQAEQKRLTVDLEAVASADKIVTLHPTALERYRADVADLAATFAKGTATNDLEAIERLRGLIERIVVTPQDYGHYAIEVEGRLAKLTGNPGIFPNGLQAVAGGGLEPPTSGL
jgi:site-specific DNA recombinase